MDDTIHNGSTPTWEIMVKSPVIEQVQSSFKLELKYGGFFRLARNSCKKVYCLGFRKHIYMETCSYSMKDLVEEVQKQYTSKSDQVLSIFFVDKYAEEQSFIQLETYENFRVMLSMYMEEKEATIYVTTDKHILQSGHTEVVDESDDENDSDSNCASEESYHSRLGTDNENEFIDFDYENYTYTKKSPTMMVNSKYSNVIAFRRALNHYALTNEFEYEIEKSDLTRLTACCANKKCEWRIHASLTQDGVTFEVKKFVGLHSCTRSNKSGNKHATQGWVADVVTDKLKSDGDVSPTNLKKWLMNTYNVEVPYMRVFRGKEQAYTDMYGKWEDSFFKIDDFKEELRRTNIGSVVEIAFETQGDKKHFQRFFISLAACYKGFLAGCRPYIGLDACHLKGKFNGVLAAATSIDGDNGMFPVAYAVLESENTNSWTWFLESLKKAIGTPNGLVISSDMQKGLEAAITEVYPDVEHRECMRHLYSNFKKYFRGEFFMCKLWGAANTYNLSKHDRLLGEIASVRGEAITYLNENHKKIWTRSKFGTAAKCDHITNNISETFNSWIGALRYKPVIDLLDGIREKLMECFDKKRRIVDKWKGTLVPSSRKYLKKISKNLGELEVCRSSDNRVEVKCKDKRWEVIIDERKCSCRVWQVTGLPCVHAAAFIAFTREANWDKYVDPCFTVEKFKEAYTLEIASMPGKDQWEHVETTEKIYLPIIKRPPGRPKKNRIVSPDEPKKRHRCSRCGIYGHHARTCKNPEPLSTSKGSHETSASKRRQSKSTKDHESMNSKSNLSG